ncbi:protein polybromo-1 [Neocloeon triangulifer]|uniref:protein polybromo-1 n=1 Tax=Neocloeon triangulifer TaxID=2078957 RepID=UPI00286ECA22|nr:protein polybromo-1 [Neocloeon triangulifer]
MSKRRRASSAASSREPEDEIMSDPEPVVEQPVRKKRRVDPVISLIFMPRKTQIGNFQVEICQQLYDTIRNFKKEDGGLLCDAFIRAPKRRQEPAYYEVVTNPIDLLRVQQKLKTDEYEDVEQLTLDIDLMVGNAKAFYKKSSQEYKDACDLWDLFEMTRNRLTDPDSHSGDGDAGPSDQKGKIILKVGKLARRAAAAEARRDDADEGASECSSTAQEDDNNTYEDLFSAVMMAQDSEGRTLHTAFQLLPSRKAYPEYYEVIDNPIDLKIIATKIQSNQYTALADLERDLQLMVKNAMSFNEPGSLIYKDAKALKRIISMKKIEIESGRSSSSKSSERIRSKRLRGNQSLSAITSALKYEDEEEDEEEEAMDEDDSDQDDDDDEVNEDDEESGPLLNLYEAVKSFTNSQGYRLSDPFRKLPSKRYYADYYKEIKNPIALSQIRAKIKNGHYGTVSEIAGDLNIMFENAKKYNRNDSKIYKDAVKLQKVMQSKVQELLEYDQESDSDEDDEGESESTPAFPQTPVVRRGRPPGSLNKPKGKPEDLLRRKKFVQIYRTLIDYHDDGRQPILMFMEKPSKKLYPDYYQVIEHPIDMLTIESNIKADKYQNEDQLVSDFKLMFTNCRQYNEEGSVIYEDANKLERLLNHALSTPTRLGTRTGSSAKAKRQQQNNLYQKLRTLFETIKDHKDPKGRQLSVIFNKLPSKIEYPDYYEVIKRPIDLEKISSKLKSTSYMSLDDMVSDFVLMFDNAFKYNEPDSQIYKDALMLQRVALQTKLQLREDEESLPDVSLAVQELLTSLFTATYNHQDEEGRCFSDSMAELPEHDDATGNKALSLDLIKRRLDRGFYRRLDHFQEDMFACLDRARRLSRSDSQVFEDAIEMQVFFIKQRDELCRGGDLLHSPALRYSAQDLAANLDVLRQEKALKELPEEETEAKVTDEAFKQPQPGDVESSGNEMSFNQQTYRVGDFVYLEPKERGLEPHIILIERLWVNQDNEQMLFGNYFYRPNETYHLTTRKFLEKEVFKSDVRVAIPMNQVIGMCIILSVRDYLRMKPETFPEKDVYVCESRYASKARSFKKIKIWPCTLPEHIKLVAREEPLEPKRVMSVFRDRVEKHKEEIAELDEMEKLPEREIPPNVELVLEQPIEGFTYFEQCRVSCGTIKTGDCVYVKNSVGKQIVAQVDAMWANKSGEEFLKGPIFVPPSEVPNTPGKLFYKQELFLNHVEEVFPLSSVTGRCVVLEHGEYISCRPTEVAEADIYVCESVYEESKKLINKLGHNFIKKYHHIGDVQEDEIYFFRRLINPAKVGSDGVHKDSKGMFNTFDRDSSPVASRDADVSLMMEDSMDAPPSVGSGDTPTPSPLMQTPVSTVKKKGTGKKLVTGYILYSSDVRKNVANRFPDSTFGEISRIVGNEWRSLTASEKQSYEERAARLNEETTARMALEAMGPGETPHQDLIYECLWANCDHQFEELNDLIEHSVGEPDGHIQKHFVSKPDSEFQCKWKGCIRQKKTVPPFPSIMRLARHCKEQHIMKATGRVVPPSERSRNFMPSAKKAAANAKAALAQNASPAVPAGLQMASAGSPTPNMAPAITAPVRQLEPMFVAIPPRPQRLLHSEAYIKYIEGMNTESRHISNWERSLKVTPETANVPDPSRLPVHWLNNGVGNHGNMVNALWALRDYLMRDSLNLAKNA